MKISEIEKRANEGEVVIIDTTLQTISERQKGDNFDEFFNWFEKGEIFEEDGKPWVNRNKIPPQLHREDLVVQNDEENGILWVYNKTRCK